MDEDLLVACVREVLVATQLCGVEQHRVHRKHGLGEVGGTRYFLAERAVARQSSQRRLNGSETNASTQAAAFKFYRHDLVSCLVRRGMTV